MKKKKTLRLPLEKIGWAAKKSIVPDIDANSVIKLAVQGSKFRKRNVNKPRILPVLCKVGGILPSLVPIFAGLSATRALASGSADIAKAVNDENAARTWVKESKRYNQVMESIALGKGLYPKTYM